MRLIFSVIQLSQLITYLYILIDCYNKLVVMKVIKRNNPTKWSENFLVYSYVDIQTVNRFFLLLTFGFSQSSFGWRILNCI